MIWISMWNLVALSVCFLFIIDLFTYFIYLSLIYLFFFETSWICYYLRIHTNIWASMYLSFYLCFSLSLSLSLSLYQLIFKNLSIYLSIIYLSIYLFIYLCSYHYSWGDTTQDIGTTSTSYTVHWRQAQHGTRESANGVRVDQGKTRGREEEDWSSRNCWVPGIRQETCNNYNVIVFLLSYFIFVLFMFCLIRSQRINSLIH